MTEYEELSVDRGKIDIFRPSDGEMAMRIEHPVAFDSQETIVSLLMMRRSQGLSLGLRLIFNALRRPLPWPPKGML